MPSSLQNPEYRKIIDRLRAEREVQGVTQQELADRLGKHQSYIAKIEGYERRLDILEFMQLAGAVGISPSKVLQSE